MRISYSWTSSQEPSGKSAQTSGAGGSAEGFSVRAGYNYTSAAFDESAYSSLTSYRPSTDFNNVKAKNTFTFGIGYRGSLIYADLAYKLDMYKSDFYAFDDISLPATQVDNSRHQLLFTLGARF